MTAKGDARTPPPRRRRPVQPATRVRLPRTARPRSTPAADMPAADMPVTEAPGNGTHGNGATGAPADELVTDDLPAGDVVTDETAAGELTDEELSEAEPEADVAAADEAPAGELTDEELTERESQADVAATDEAAGDETAEDADDEPATGRDAADAGSDAGAAGRSPLLLPACLGVVAVILGGLAVWFALQAGSVTSGVDTSNVALTNPTATSQVSQQITSAVNTIFSYNYANTAKTSQAAAALLTGKAKGEYNTLFKLVRQDAPKEKLVLTTAVTNSGVEYLIGNQARVLVFANQQDTAGSAHKTTDAGAMFAVNAVYEGGRWKIAHIDTFSAAG